MFGRVVAIAVGAFAAVALFLAGGRLMFRSLERQLIYFPTRIDRSAPTPRIPGAAVDEIWLRTSDGVRIHALDVRPERPFADVLFFHGNAGSLYDRVENIARLADAGFRVLIVDYRGYGKSEGRPSEGGLYRDADAAYAYLTESGGVAPDRVVVFGRSLGSAVALDLATRRPVGALIAESAFTSARDLARLHYAWIPKLFLGAMSHELDSHAKVRRLSAPVLFIHGLRDSIVPAALGRRLYDAAPEPKAWYPIERAGHNDTWTVGGEAYFQRLVDFVREHVPTTQQANAVPATDTAGSTPPGARAAPAIGRNDQGTG